MTEDEEIASTYKEFMDDTQRRMLDKLRKLDKVPYTDDVPDFVSQAIQEAYLKVKGDPV